MSSPSESVQQTDPKRAIAWAFYLGISWTWCIGMFLPILLVRDYGPLGWVIFAIPNVLGAAAMGWAFKTRNASLTVVAKHTHATNTFSLVTISFHAFFVPWLLSQLLGPLAAAIGTGLLILVSAPLLLTRLSAPMLAGIVFLFSIFCATALTGASALALPAWRGAAPFDLLALTAVCTLGFLTCPYLDLTFHRARQHCLTPGESKIAFGVGFGVIFASMIVLTLLYTPLLLGTRGTESARWIIALHVLVQACFTVGIHTGALRSSASSPEAHRAISTGLVAAVAIGAALAIAARAYDSSYNPTAEALVTSEVEPETPPTIGGLTGGEFVYRSYLSFYGLIAPAYVWLCMFPTRGFTRPHPRQLLITALSILLALPFFVVAFIYRRIEWVVPGVAIILAARLLLDRVRRDWLEEERAILRES